MTPTKGEECEIITVIMLFVVCHVSNQRQRHQLWWILALEKVEQANKSLREMEMVE